MKLVALVLAVVAFVGAQRMRATILLQLNRRGIVSYAGLLDLVQPSPESNIAISGVIEGLPPKLYAAVVHEKRFINQSCENLGPMRQLTFYVPSVFIFSLVDTTTDSNSVSAYSLSGTLHPDRPYCIDHYVIALYDAATFYLAKRNSSIGPIACGLVETDSSPL